MRFPLAFRCRERDSEIPPTKHVTRPNSDRLNVNAGDDPDAVSQVLDLLELQPVQVREQRAQ
jgi:hypothetical protein